MVNDGGGQKEKVGRGKEAMEGGSGLLRCIPLPSRGNTGV